MERPKLTLVQSSNIAGINYTPSDEPGPDGNVVGRLIVKFNNGTFYHYDNVPETIGTEIFEAESVGRYFMTFIRNSFKGTRMPGCFEMEVADEAS